MSNPRAAASAPSPLIRRFRNLKAVPSFHYDGIFGRVVHELFALAPPHAVALELPPEMQREMEWAAGCWPGPVVSIGTSNGPGAAATTLPFVTGDSILEAFRLATARGIPIAFVDSHVRTTQKERAARSCRLPGAELAGRTGGDYLAVAEGLMALDPVGSSDLAREAVMARHLAALMKQYDSVLWVGGLAHWSRIEARLASGQFASARVRRELPLRWRRGRLDPSALHRMTGQTPWRIRSFAGAPLSFDPLAAVRRLLHESGEQEPVEAGIRPEPCTAIDRARAGIYARNLAATEGTREEPHLSELVLAARDIVGPRYAARVYRRGMLEETTTETEKLDPLTFETDGDRHVAGYRFRGRWISVEPWHPVGRPILTIPNLVEVERSERDADYAGLPPSSADEKFFWGAYPPDQAEYEAFVEYVLRRASISDPGEARVVPFMSGLADGLDVRATIRFWHEDRLYVREEQRGQLNVRNGAIDWTSDTEQSDVLQRRPDGGWNEPDSPHVGSVSREFGHKILENFGEAQVTLRTRQWSAITLDCPTHLDDPGGRETFFNTVISQLLNIPGQPTSDNLYGWLRVVFAYATGKPFVYCSRYVPSARVFGLAREYDVQLVWSPLHRIPSSLLERHRTWRQLWLSESQWERLTERMATAKTGRPGLANLIRL
ncbi:MAG: hypothetical protein ABIS06_16525 [Vicinamibacterales bacterium]